jgi:hypothetical protein
MTATDKRTINPLQDRITMICVVFIFIGLLTFIIRLMGDHPAGAWQAYLINFLLWSAVAQGGMLFAVVMHLTRARWSGPLNGLSQAFFGFFPISFILFVFLFLGKSYVFPWLHHDLHGKEVWLNVPFLFTRDAIALLVLYGLGFMFLNLHLQIRALTSGQTNPIPEKGIRAFFFRSRREPAADLEQLQQKTSVVAVLYAIAFAVVLSLIGYDLVMAMQPHWISTLFGAYCFVKAFYVGLGGLIILAAAVYLKQGEQSTLKPAHFHDVGKLFFAFCLVWADFFYVQLVVIWYGNIPEETHYIIERVMHMPWQGLAWTVFIICFVLPFFILLNQNIKKHPKAMIVICGVIIMGIWLEHFLLVAPPMHPHSNSLPLSPGDVLMTLGFLGLFMLAIRYFLALFPELLPQKRGEAS